MADLYDQLYGDGGDSSAAIAGFGIAKLRQAWPTQFVSDEQRGVVPRRRAGLAGVGVPPQAQVSDLPDAPWTKPANPFDKFDFDPDDYLKAANTPVTFDDLVPQYGAGESAFEGALKGASANWRDEIYGASKASGLPEWLGGLRAPVGAARLAYERYMQPKSITGLVTGDMRGPIQKEYEKARDEMRAREAAMAQQHPYAFGAGELGGAAATMLAVPGSSAPTIAGRLGRSALTGAGYGALAGAGEGQGEEGMLAEGARGALTGAALGTVGAGAAELASPIVSRVANVYRGIRDPDLEAQRRIAAAVRADMNSTGSRFSPQEVIESDIAGTPRALLDTGETTRALGRSAANTSPEGRAALQEFVHERFEQQSPRIAAYIRDLTGGGNATEDLERIGDVARRANRPAYRAAYQAGESGLWTPELERLASSPAVRNAMQAAVQRGRDRAVAEGMGAFNPGVTFDNGIMQFGRGRGAPPYPNMQYWDYVQRELRDMQTVARRAGRNEEAGALGTLHRSLLAELDAANPAFARARQGAAQFFGAENALEAGQNFVRSSANIPEAQRALLRMSPAERQLFARGYASNLADAVERSGDNQNVINKTFFNSGAARSRTLLALGPDRAARLEALLRAERIVDRGRTALGNSTTARQLFEMGLAGGAGAGAEALLEQNFNPQHMLTAALTVGLARRGAQAIDQRVARRVGELLTSPDLSAIHRGIRLVTQNPRLLNALRRVTGAFAGAGTEAAETSGRASGGGASAGGANDETFLADCQRAGLSISPRARGGRVRGELSDANKATHEEVGYVATTPFPKRRCSLCVKYIHSGQGGPACKKVASPINMHGFCKRFVTTTFAEDELRAAFRNAVARGESRDVILRRMRERGVPVPAGV
jgi:hypothetical protein